MDRALHRRTIGTEALRQSEPGRPEPGSVADIERLVRWRHDVLSDIAALGVDLGNEMSPDEIFQGALRRSLDAASARHLRALLSTGAVRDPAARAVVACVLTEREERPLVPAPLGALLGLVAAVAAIILVVQAPGLAVRAFGVLIDLVLR